jgi:hypothetical protein
MRHPISPSMTRRKRILMHAENCFVVAAQGKDGAETWMFVWLLRLAGAPA